MPHKTKHPRGVTDVNRSDSVVEVTQSIKDEATIRGVATLGSRDEGGPDETLEVLVARGDDGELLDEEAGDVVVVRGEPEPGVSSG